jgi:hypothetical protein
VEFVSSLVELKKNYSFEMWQFGSKNKEWRFITINKQFQQLSLILPNFDIKETFWISKSPIHSFTVEGSTNISQMINSNESYKVHKSSKVPKYWMNKRHTHTEREREREREIGMKMKMNERLFTSFARLQFFKHNCICCLLKCLLAELYKEYI